MPFSVGWRCRLARAGLMLCVESVQWASTQLRTCSAFILPSGLGRVMTFVPDASTAPVSWTAIWAVSAATTADATERCGGQLACVRRRGNGHAASGSKALLADEPSAARVTVLLPRVAGGLFQVGSLGPP